MASHLSETARQRAVGFINAFANDLQRAIAAHAFQNGSAGAVIEALAAYQNEDGGFARGLEADLRTHHSSVIATTIGLQILASVHALDTAPGKHALGYLAAQYEQGNWPLITPACNDAPHAPWWTWRDDMAATVDFRPNPGAEILAYFSHSNVLPYDVLDDLFDRARTHLDAHELEMHDLLCYVRLVDSQETPGTWRSQLEPGVIRHAHKLVATEPDQWDEYCLTPLDVAVSPDCLLARHFTTPIGRQLDRLIDTQTAEGSWTPAWSWGGAWPETWPGVEREIKVTLTIRNLQILKAYSRSR